MLSNGAVEERKNTKEKERKREEGRRKENRQNNNNKRMNYLFLKIRICNLY
jgi:hypothetical protein